MVLVWVLLCAVAFGANHAGDYDNAWCWEGKVCTENGQCKQPNGVNGACCLGKCRHEKLSRGELCGSSLPDSTCPGCDNNLACSDTGNKVMKCEQQALANGCPCNGTAKCISTQPCLSISGVCGPKEVLPGGACEVKEQCYANSLCTSGKCQRIVNGQTCSIKGSLDLCVEGSVCSDKGDCITIVVSGKTCAQDYECAAAQYCVAASNQCSNRAVLLGTCTGTGQGSCVVNTLCNSGICVTPRTVADGQVCSEAFACVSGTCSNGKCIRTHFATAGQDCTAHLDCEFGATCLGTKKCSPSGLGTQCEPTLNGGDMDKECQGSNDLYCSCAGQCLAIAKAILPQSSSATSKCQAAKDALAGLKVDDLKKIDIPTDATVRKNIAIDQCCRRCSKDDRVSIVGVMIDCSTEILTVPAATADFCSILGADPIALSNCPTRTSYSDASALAPVLGMWAALLCLVM